MSGNLTFEGSWLKVWDEHILLSHVSFMVIIGYEMVALEVWAHKHINRSNKIQRHPTHRLENHGSLSI
jgi:hypothetical protein